jgi:hypothetical protein
MYDVAVEWHEAIQPQDADEVAQPMTSQGIGDVSRAT